MSQVKTREEIEGIVLDQLRRTVMKLEGQPIDTSRSMKDLGANSLDIVEVVSGAMRTLRVRVPRGDLEHLKDLDGLIDLLHVKALEKA
ncbi:MAG: phosphopantetheine-binding protein [bacterium]